MISSIANQSVKCYNSGNYYIVAFVIQIAIKLNYVVNFVANPCNFTYNSI